MDTIVAFFLEGGFWMYPIMIVGAIGLATGIERFVKLTKIELANKQVWERIQPVLAKGDFDAAMKITADDSSTVSKLLESGLALQGSVRRREDIEIAMEEEMMGIIPMLEKRIASIALYANISTLLGLLGTILGLIAAFNAVASANPAEKADLLSASISIAMNTTAFGLITAIPLLFIHSYMNSKCGAIVDSLEMVSVRTLNVISRKAKRPELVKAA
ncbi:MotA/TolQ/ExbB proton channel family protein [Aestuariicella hydrocarbonica]|uniref:MotA/TolQ/ExbB proton channel family protein n=1 Tax=Pseudomaricurvus hydrocarbonicus TaxID=1470433 RepID=A0A9E5JTH4_9GAMM|nr:MotA/TolQ/ExbB proton channel family protein [Aestuariicella hydrocarbonica]